MNHACINVATYGKGGRFTMTDRGRSALRQSRDVFEVGPSRIVWDKGTLVIEVNEVSSWPLVSRVRGTIRLTPRAITDQEALLTPDGRHLWRPFAPMADIEVDMSQGHSWRGHGYFDANFGTAALEADFRYWSWGRYPLRDRTLCFYDAVRRDGSALALGVSVDATGKLTRIDPPPLTRFSRSLWAVRRDTRADPGTRPRQVMGMLDAPFYTRSLVQTRLDGEDSTGVHEALDLVRFRSPLIKPMLALRVPRRVGWSFPPAPAQAD